MGVGLRGSCHRGNQIGVSIRTGSCKWREAGDILPSHYEGVERGRESTLGQAVKIAKSKTATGVAALVLGAVVIAVSYTHLDVYKRQILFST